MMTKKHFIKIGSILTRCVSVRDVIAELCIFFAEDNPNFDRGKFIDACNREAAEHAEAERVANLSEEDEDN